MRNGLKKIGNETRETYTAEVERFGIKKYRGYQKKTILLTKIKDQNNKIVTDHLWFTMGKKFEELNLKKGDVIQFTARVAAYKKGYLGEFQLQEIDYKLSYPTNICKINDCNI